jgi:hypothetical protein
LDFEFVSHPLNWAKKIIRCDGGDGLHYATSFSVMLKVYFAVDVTVPALSE